MQNKIFWKQLEYFENPKKKGTLCFGHFSSVNYDSDINFVVTVIILWREVTKTKGSLLFLGFSNYFIMHTFLKTIFVYYYNSLFSQWHGNSDIKYSNQGQIICIQIYSFKYSYQIQIIFKEIYLIHKQNPNSSSYCRGCFVHLAQVP